MSMAPVQAYIGLGANLGDLPATLQAALAALAALSESRLDAVSAAYRTAPVEAGGPDYLNAVARVETALAPEILLDALQSIEQTHGRQRPYPNAPRTLDLDLLLYGEQQIANARLTVPHPRLAQRAFVLHPLLELAPTLRAPGLGLLSTHLADVAGQRIERLDIPLNPKA